MAETKVISRLELELVTEYLLATLRKMRERIADGPVTLGQIDQYAERALKKAKEYGIEEGNSPSRIGSAQAGGTRRVPPR